MMMMAARQLDACGGAEDGGARSVVVVAEEGSREPEEDRVCTEFGQQSTR